MSMQPPARVVRSADVDWRRYRNVRLRALAQDPDAFGSSLAREEAFDDATWAQRASTPGTFLWVAPDTSAADPMGLDGGRSELRADGLIGLFPGTLYLDDPGAPAVRATFGTDSAHLAFVTQMWVAPARRGSGAFDALMDAVIAHARATDVRVVALHVHRDNARAASAYRRFGFVLVDHPLPECPPDEDEYVLPLV